MFLGVVVCFAFSSFAQEKAQTKTPSQSHNVSNLAGTWLLKEATVRENGQPVDSISRANCFWADHYNKKIPVEIAKDGSLKYIRGEYTGNATLKIENGNLIFYFSTNGNAKKLSDKGETGEGSDAFSYTVYQYALHGNQFMIMREDPEFSEKYVFKRQ